MNKALIAGLLVYVGFLLNQIVQNPEAKARELDLDNIVQFTSASLDMGFGSCSGVVIDAEHILTAGHCVADLKKNVALEATVNGRTYLAYWKDRNLATDIAILVVPHADFQNPIRIATLSPPIGSTIYCIGNPHGDMPDTITKGILGNKHRSGAFSQVPRWQYDCTIFSGNSGGMVIDEAGELIAITTEMMSGPKQMGSTYAFGVPLEEIQKFLRGELPASRPESRP